MADNDFKDLNARVIVGTATEEEYEWWEQLKQQLLSALEGPKGQRQHLRASIVVEVGFAKEQQLIRTELCDIGAGGLRLVMPGFFAVGAQVNLYLRLLGDVHPVRVHARVVWSHKNGTVSLEFVDLPADVRDRIDALVWEESLGPIIPSE